MIATALLFSLHATSFQRAAQVPQKMFCVHVAGDELGALTHDFRQSGFAISVDGCHLDQLNDVFPRVPCVARFSPSRQELNRPLADQLTLQRPPLLIGQIGYSDLQHYSPLTAYQKLSACEVRMTHTLPVLSTICSSITRHGQNMSELR
jgi:hypothetical protein